MGRRSRSESISPPIGRTSFTYDYEIVDEENRSIASARTVQVMYDYATAKPVPIPDEIRQKMLKS